MTRGGAGTWQLLATGNFRGTGLDSLWSIVGVIAVALVEWIKKRQISVTGPILSATGLVTRFSPKPLRVLPLLGRTRFRYLVVRLVLRQTLEQSGHLFPG